jgi:hypothetical protein
LGGGDDERARHGGLSLGSISASLLNFNSAGPVTAKLDGQAQINVSLSIDASPELVTLMRGNVSKTATAISGQT